jgi:hypothetical protein
MREDSRTNSITLPSYRRFGCYGYIKAPENHPLPESAFINRPTISTCPVRIFLMLTLAHEAILCECDAVKQKQYNNPTRTGEQGHQNQNTSSPNPYIISGVFYISDPSSESFSLQQHSPRQLMHPARNALKP